MRVHKQQKVFLRHLLGARSPEERGARPGPMAPLCSAVPVRGAWSLKVNPTTPCAPVAPSLLANMLTQSNAERGGGNISQGLTTPTLRRPCRPGGALRPAPPCSAPRRPVHWCAYRSAPPRPAPPRPNRRPRGATPLAPTSSRDLHYTHTLPTPSSVVSPRLPSSPQVCPSGYETRGYLQQHTDRPTPLGDAGVGRAGGETEFRTEKEGPAGCPDAYRSPGRGRAGSSGRDGLGRREVGRGGAGGAGWACLLSEPSSIQWTDPAGRIQASAGRSSKEYKTEPGAGRHGGVAGPEHTSPPWPRSACARRRAARTPPRVLSGAETWMACRPAAPRRHAAARPPAKTAAGAAAKGPRPAEAAEAEAARRCVAMRPIMLGSQSA